MLRAGGMCEDCMDEWEHCDGVRPQPATVVHHILPLRQHPEMALDMGNLRCLCATHHAKRHPEKGQRAPGEDGNKPAAGILIVKI